MERGKLLMPVVSRMQGADRILLMYILLFWYVRADADFEPELAYYGAEDFPVTQANCDEFFFSMPFPRPSASYKGLVKLCQTQQHDGFVGPAMYATLYSTRDRIPIYSASVVSLYPLSYGNMRPDKRYWERVSLALCNMDAQSIPDYPVSSRIAMIKKEDLLRCRNLQAVERDYSSNRRLNGLERGHLNPNAINFQDRERQMSTFTLTNAAPQYYQFDEISWEELECMTKYVIFTFTPLERVYIITGTLDSAKNESGDPLWMNGDTQGRKNLVRVPGFYWKAVCYPGDPWKKKPAWSYVIVQRNTRGGGESGPDKFMSVREFSSQHFLEDLFHAPCMDAPTGPIETLFSDWKNNVDKFCRRAFVKTTNLRWSKDEV